MDIWCPRCGEPWDLDTLHDELEARFAAEDGSPPAWTGPEGRHDQAAYEALFAQVREDFAARGCAAIASYDGRCTLDAVGSPAANRAALLMSLLGDDVDAIAAMTEDLDVLGHARGPDLVDPS